MNDTVVQVNREGLAWHATSVAHVVSSSPELAARTAAARAMNCSVEEVELSEPTKFGVYVASKRDVEPVRRAS